MENLNLNKSIKKLEYSINKFKHMSHLLKLTIYIVLVQFIFFAILINFTNYANSQEAINNEIVEVAPVQDAVITQDIQNLNLKIKSKIPNAEKITLGASVRKTNNNKSEVVLNSISAGDKSKDLTNYDFRALIDNLSVKTGEAVKLPFNQDVLKNIISELLAIAPQIELQSNLPSLAAKSGSGGGLSENGGANALPTIAPLATTTPKKITYKTIADGCPIRVDISQNKAIQQTKLITLEDGVETNTADCADSALSFIIEKSYQGCTDFISNGVANPRFRQKYTNATGDTKYLGECAIDAEKTFKITEDFTSCGVSVDTATQKVIRKSRKYYNDLNGNPVEVSACANSSQTIAMTKFAGCQSPNEFPSLMNEIADVWEYMIDGTTQRVGACPVVEVRVDTASCQNRVDYSQAKVFLQEKKQAFVGNSKVKETACADSANFFAMTKSFDGCSDVLNTAGGIANPRYKWKYANSTGAIQTLGECTIDAEKTFKITEDLSSCGVEIDAVLNKVWVKSKKSYNDINGNPVEVSACAKSAQSVALASTACTLKEGYPVPSQAIGFKKTYSYQGSEFIYESCPVIDYTETVGNCAVRIDSNNNQVYKQTTKQAIMNNKVVSQTPCADADPAIQYQIYKSYSDCTVKKDIVNNVIIPRYKTFYLENNAQKTIINDTCTDDSEIKHNIVEDFASCGVLVDYDANVVRRKSNTYYYNLDGNRHDIDSCAVSATAPTMALSVDTEPCSVFDDFTLNKSFQQEALTYIFNGQKFQARGCQNSKALFWNHEKFKLNESGNLLCSVGKSPLGDAVIIFYRTGYIRDGVKKYITQCNASETETAIETTMDGCIDMNQWLHDFNAGFTRSRTRTFFNLDGTRKYLTNCADGTQTFNHTYQLQSWQFQDASLNNYPLYQVYITVAGVRYNLKNNHIISGAIAQPYQLVSTAVIDAPANTFTYQGCTKTIPQMNQGTYRRGDNSLYVAPGVTNGTNRSVYACISQNISVSNPYGTASYNSQNGIVSLINNNSGADLLPSGSSVYRKFQFNYVKSGQTIASSPINALTKFSIGSNWGIAWGCGDSNGNGAYGTSATYALCNSAQTPSMNPYTYSITLGQAWLRDDNQVIYGF